MVELVDTSDLGSDAARCGGSSPFIRTLKGILQQFVLSLFFINDFFYCKKNKILSLQFVEGECQLYRK